VALRAIKHCNSPTYSPVGWGRYPLTEQHRRLSRFAQGNSTERLSFPSGAERLLYKSGQRATLAVFKMRRWMARQSDTARIAGLGPDSISHLAIFDSTRSLMLLNQLDTCLTGLRQQGISVNPRADGENGSTFEVMGFTLTAEQIVELHKNGKMDANGIKALAKNIKQSF
jgi:hypothetical protein